MSRRATLQPFLGRFLPWDLRARRVHRRVEALACGVADAEFRTLLGEIDGRAPYGGNRIEVFTQGDAAFAAMTEAIDGARREVLLESYIFNDDRTGRDFAHRLRAAAARRAKVRVTVDAVGSIGTRNAFWAELRAARVRVRRFHRLIPHFFKHPFRNHRKILVVDREVGFTGGMNIGEEYGSAPAHPGSSPHRPMDRARPWRDTHVRVAGPVARELAAVFREGWVQAGGPRFGITRPVEGVPLGAEVMVLESNRLRGQLETAATLAAIVAAARRRVWITNAYFAPPRFALEVLARAARRGVDVRLLLPGKTDMALVRHAGHGYFRTLLEAGVRIWEYQAAVLHAKTLVADDLLSVVGSTNLDFRSLRFNGECNLVMFDARTAGELARAFEADLAESREIELEAWRRRPWWHRLGDRAARWLAPLL